MLLKGVDKRIGDDAYYFSRHVLWYVFQREGFTDGIFARPVLPRHSLIDDYNSPPVLIVTIVEVTTAHDGNSHRTEVIRRNPKVPGRWFFLYSIRGQLRLPFNSKNHSEGATERKN